LTSPGCLGCGPGARALRAESIDWVSPFPGRSVRLPRRAAGPWAIHRIAPTRIQPEGMILALCPPVPWNQRRLIVSARKALAPGPGTRGRAAFRWRSFIIRIERFLGFRLTALPGVMTGGEVFVEEQDETGIQRAGMISIRMVASFSRDAREASFSWTSPRSLSFSASSCAFSALTWAVMTSLFSWLSRLIFKAPS